MSVRLDSNLVDACHSIVCLCAALCASSGRQQAVIDTGSHAIAEVRFSPDGRYIGCSRTDGSLTLYDSHQNFAPVSGDVVWRVYL